jgi:succinoglycan biosynthesis transport protein ExoP
MNMDSGLQMADLAGTIRRRGKLILIIAGATMLVAYWVAMAMPNQYAAGTLILVEPQSIDEQLVRAGIRESDLNQRLGIMTAQILSRSRLSAIIEEMKLYEDWWDDMTREEVVEIMRAAVHVQPVLSELEQARKRGEVETFNTFSITYSSRSARLAAAVANRIADDFIDEHIEERVKVSQKSLDFMENSINALVRQIREVEADITIVKRENPGRLPDELRQNQQLMQRSIVDLGVGQNRLAEATSDEAFWKSQVLAAATMTSSNDDASPERRLMVLELMLAETYAKGFTDKHPDVIRVRAELEAMEQQIRSVEDDGVEKSVGSYAEQNARAEHRRAELRITTATNDLARTTENIRLIEERIAATPAVAEQLDSLERGQLHLAENMRDFNGRLQTATVQADLERRQLGEQLRILEPAFEPPGPVSPNRILLLALGLIAGMALGGAAGLVLEGADSSVHTALQLQSMANIPVLAAIPSIMLEPDRIARTRRNIREAIAVAAVVVFSLAGGAFTYMYVNGAPAFMTGDDEEGVEESIAPPTEALRVPSGRPGELG